MQNVFWKDGDFDDLGSVTETDNVWPGWWEREHHDDDDGDYDDGDDDDDDGDDGDDDAQGGGSGSIAGISANGQGNHFSYQPTLLTFHINLLCSILISTHLVWYT